MGDINIRSKNRIQFINYLQFIGVISVIFGHAMNSIDVPSVFLKAKEWVYTYHMPLFFFVSAFLFSYKGGYSLGKANVINKRFKRLMIPYIIWNVIFIIPKYLVFPLLPDQKYDMEISFRYFWDIIIYPRKCILGHTWFLFALFEMFLLAIILVRIVKIKQLWPAFIALLIVINCFNKHYLLLAIGDISKNCIYFFAGLIIGGISISKIEDFVNDYRYGCSVFISIIVLTIIWIYYPYSEILVLLMGFLIISFIVFVQVYFNISNSIIDFVSVYSFAIYIMHWPVIMIFRLLFYTILDFNPVTCFLINMVSGLLVPIIVISLIKKINIKPINKMSSIMFGM